MLFIEASKNNYDDPATNLRLQKLLYFAQGWALVKLGRPLFKESIEAWDLGPVARSVYKTFQSHGAYSIIEAGDIDLSRFSQEEKQLLIDVFMKYRNDSTYKLINLTHEPDTPWDKAYRNGRNSKISLSDMKEYFSKMKLEHVKINKNKLYTYERDSEGNPIFPEGVLDD